MRRYRLLTLVTIPLISGAVAIACSSGDDSTNMDSGVDSSTKDATTSDVGKDSTTTMDATADATSDVTTSDAPSDSPTTDGAPSDAGGALTVMVVRAGGSLDAGDDASLSGGAAQPVFVEERNVSDGSLVRTIPLPTTASGSNEAFSISGSATSEGALTTSADGKFVVLGGYAATPGTTNVASTSVFDGGTLRVIARIDHAGNVDTSTELAAFDQNNIRGAATADGGSFWATGTAASDGGLGGTQYVMLSSTGTTVNVVQAPANLRAVGIYGGQLYVSSQTAGFIGVSSVGTNLPTTTGQSATLLPGFGGDAGSPYGFSLLDLDASVTGVDTLYVADDSSQVKGGGIQKWVSSGTSWTKLTTFTSGTTSGFRGVTAVVVGADVIVLGTTADATQNSIIKYVDDGVNLTPTGTVLATASTGTIFRGIALAPQ